MLMKKLLPLCLLAVFLVGCAASGKMNQLRVGMTKQQAITALGSPTSTSAIDDVEYLNYRLSPGIFMIDDYFVKVKNGKVEAFGRSGDFGIDYY